MQFRIFRIPVHVSTSFWLTGLLLGLLAGDPELVVPAVAVVFVAILAHELGHALTARAFGVEPVIHLVGLGGMTEFRGQKLGRGRTIITTLAGPFAGFALGGVAALVDRFAPVGGTLAPKILGMIELCTFGWGLVNLVPVLPLDGGVVLRELLGPQRLRVTFVVSGVVGMAAAALLLVLRYPMGALLFGMATVQSLRAAWSYGELREEEKARNEAAKRELEGARRSQDFGRIADAEAKAGAALAMALDADVRDDARRLLARLAIDAGKGMPAVHYMSAIETRRDDDDVTLAEALDVAGERTAAFRLLEHRTAQCPSGPALGALLRGLMAIGATRRAAELARTYVAVGNVDALAEAAEAFHEAGAFDEAAALFGALFDRTGAASFAFDTARARSARGDVEGAYAMLEAAILAGFGDARRLAADASLGPVRDDPRFARLLARLPSS